MKAALIVCLLIVANVVWFNMLSELRRRGYRVSYVNFLSDLKAYHLLIVNTEPHHERHKFTFALIVLYLIVAVTLVAVIFV
jgi:hypothetical protein